MRMSRLSRTRWLRIVLAVLAMAGMQLAGARAAMGLGCAVSGATPPAAASHEAAAHATAHAAASAATSAPVTPGALAADGATPSTDVAVALPGTCSVSASLPAASVRRHAGAVLRSPCVPTPSETVSGFIPAPPFHPPRLI